jgi:hypothetical protein
MRHPSSKRPSGKAAPSGGPVIEDADRRGALRYQFTAAAEVVDVNSGTRIASRTADVSLGGCFLDTLTPLPIGSLVRLCVHRGNVPLEVTGRVIYSQTGLGMGIAFSDLSLEQQSSLEGWLADLNSPRLLAYEAAAPKPKREEQDGAGSRTLIRLIHLLVGRGMLSEEDAASLLRDSLP